jgi:hypothetical protein
MRIFSLLFILSCCIPISLTATGHEDKHKHEHKQHSYVGSHGMVLFAAGDTVLASHLPLYRAPHDYQLVYQLALPAAEEQAVLALLRGGQQLTLLPQNFDLRLLIEGKTFDIGAAVYQGHFERGGRLWLDNIQLTFARQLYRRPLQQLSIATNAQYDMFSVADSHFLLHRIAAAPSFDQILQLPQLPATPVTLATTDGAATLPLLKAMGISATQLYLETADLSQ